MSDYKHIGKDFTPPDVVGKVTGKAKYAEDFKADGMVFARMYTSPMAHGRVTNIDTSIASAMPSPKPATGPRPVTPSDASAVYPKVTRSVHPKR